MRNREELADLDAEEADLIAAYNATEDGDEAESLLKRIAVVQAFMLEIKYAHPFREE